MARDNLRNAQTSKSDEFYTQYEDIQREINAFVEFNENAFRGKCVLLPCDDPEWSNFTLFFAQNFERLGLRKLISTSYAVESKKYKQGYQLSLFELDDPQYDPDKSKTNGKIFILEKDENNDEIIDIKDLKWHYLEGDGDFNSDEVRALRDEADIIVTNPPFSLFREFLKWILEAGKQFAIIGNQNAISYQEVFPLIQENKIWLGYPFKGNVGFFKSPYNDVAKASDHREGLIRVSGVMWFTNIDLGRRHNVIQLMTMADNIKFSSHKDIKEFGYRHYDNYDAIDVPYSDSIPSDYDGVMGVPITFMDKYNPQQFEIIGIAKTPVGAHLRTKIYEKQIQFDFKNGFEKQTSVSKLNDGPAIKVNEKPSEYPFYKVGDDYFVSIYARILIRRIR